MIPQNTIILTMEMIRQLDMEQAEIKNELERYNSWLNIFQIQFVDVMGKLELVRKKFTLNSKKYLNKITKGEIFHENRFMS